MDPLQSIVALLVVVALAAAPAVLYAAGAADRKAQAGSLPHVMTGAEAAARHLYGEAHGWDRKAMIKFDGREVIREPWVQEAQKRIESVAGQLNAGL